MQSTSSSSSLNPALLPSGTQVGPFRVMDWAGRGVHGAVYRAVRIGQERLPPVALKLALLPKDPRMARERELLSRTLHPHIPRLVDHGSWQSPSGERHPWVAMEWIDGVPLYDWARLFRPSAAQQLRLLAQVALALQALHAQGAFHRDLKGGNLLVRRIDSRVFLTDFGSGIYPDADTLTPQQLPPGTPAYRSPEAWLFTLQFRHTSERYRAGPADDVFALGVTACVLATGSYPDMGEPRKDEHGTWHLDSLVLPRALFSSRVEGPLRALILRMLSLRPEQRGTPAELAQALEQAADLLSPPSLLPSHSGAEPAAARSAEAPADEPQAPVHSRPLWLALAVVAGALATWAGWLTRAAFFPDPEIPSRASQATHPATMEGSPEEEPVGLGEAAASTTPAPPSLLGEAGVEVQVPLVQEPSKRQTLSQETPPKPFPGQVTPDAKGQCPGRTQIPINGGCWLELSTKDAEACEEDGYVFFKARCYAPAMGSRRKPAPTSAPPDFR